MNIAQRLLGAAVLLATSAAVLAQESFDVVIYGGSSAGIAASIQAARMGKTAVVLEPSACLGGLTTGGLGATDIGNSGSIGGIAREFYARIYQYYQDPTKWKHETPEQYEKRERLLKIGSGVMFGFEPHVATKVYDDMLADVKDKVKVLRNQRLDLKNGVKKEGGRIVSIAMESGQSFAGRIFIDATYEGDLMARAGVTYFVGREANAQYGETLDGVEVKHAKFHQFTVAVDPYVKKGDPSSGLVPFIHAGPPGNDGDGDKRVQAYCFRMCLTTVPENRVPFPKPEGYDEKDFELLFRNYEAGYSPKTVMWLPRGMPNKKTDTNNREAFSTDFIGMNYDYPEADHAAREKITAAHRKYQMGLMWTLANHPRIPENVRKQVSAHGLAKDEFVDNGNWPTQLYIREARRMVGDYVVTENDVWGKRRAEDPVGLGSYGMDSHNVQRYVDAKGQARNEGDVEVGGFPPYPVSYRAIVPRSGECPNLLVPVCVSATHIAYGSIRMEPVFMILGQSAATAGCMAIDAKIDVQKVPYDQLQARLLADKQLIQWKAPAKPGK